MTRLVWLDEMRATSTFANASTPVTGGRGQTREFGLRPAVQDRQRETGIVVRARAVPVSSAGHLELEHPLRESER